LAFTEKNSGQDWTISGHINMLYYFDHFDSKGSFSYVVSKKRASFEYFYPVLDQTTSLCGFLLFINQSLFKTTRRSA
jgi:hypothetical protein